MIITILAAGTWGTTLAKVLSEKNEVRVWTHSGKEAEELNKNRIHINLPGVMIPDNILFGNNIEDLIKDVQIIIMATPSFAVRQTAGRISNLVNPDQIIVSVTKGIEEKSLLFMSEVIKSELTTGNKVVALSGPTHAEEVARNLPTLIVSASEDLTAAGTVQRLFTGTCVRPYLNDDIKGIELCGALKNIVAIACGIATGLGYGDNSRAAIITRGMTEIKRLGAAMGCKDETFFGLAGIGDLTVTATSRYSRNNMAGQYIGQGLPVDEAVKKVGMVVEGINALPAALGLSEKYNIELPIINAVDEIINKSVAPKEAVNTLWSRDYKYESGNSFEKELLRI